MFNQLTFDWNWDTKQNPPLDVPVFILVEFDVVHEATTEIPHVREAILQLYPDRPFTVYWKLLDANADEDDILQQTFSVVAWRFRDQPAN